MTQTPPAQPFTAPITLVDALHARLNRPGGSEVTSHADIRDLLERPRLLSGPLHLRALRGEDINWPGEYRLGAVALMGLWLQLDAGDLHAQERAAHVSPPDPWRASQLQDAAWSLRDLILTADWDAHADLIHRGGERAAQTEVARTLAFLMGLLTGLPMSIPALQALRAQVNRWTRRAMGVDSRGQSRARDVILPPLVSALPPGTPLDGLSDLTGPVTEDERADLISTLTQLRPWGAVERWITDPAQIIPLTCSDTARQLRLIAILMKASSRPEFKLAVAQAGARSLDFGPPEPGLTEVIPWLSGGEWQWAQALPEGHAAAVKRTLTRALELISQSRDKDHPGLIMSLLQVAGHPTAARAVEVLFLDLHGTQKGEEQRTYTLTDRDAGRTWHLHLALLAWLPLVRSGTPLVHAGRSAQSARAILNAPEATGLILATRVIQNTYRELKSNGSHLVSLEAWPKLLGQVALAEEALNILRAQPEWAPDESQGAGPRLNGQISGLHALLSHQTSQDRPGGA